MRFVGQGAEVNVPVPAGPFTRFERTGIRRLFDDVYEKLYGRTYPDSEVEFINFKIRASLPERLLTLPRLDGATAGRTLDDAIKGERPAYSPISGGFIPTSASI